jgi:cell division topological specificity factor
MSWFHRNPTSDVAKERLKLILVQDRSLLPNDQFERMKGELINVLNGYFEFNRSEIRLNIQRNVQKTVFEATVPVISVKRGK